MIQGTHYTISAKNLRAHELIGLFVRVCESSDPKKKGIEGVVVDETKNTFVLDCNGKQKTVPKKECVFEFDLNGETCSVKGIEVNKRPEDRVKES